MKVWLVALVLTLMAWAAGPASADEAAPESGAWVEITPQPMRIGGHLFEPTCSHAPGADPAYSFWARQGTSDNLVIFFDGGGACWDDLTCSVPWLNTGRIDDGFYKAEILDTDNPNRFGGVFELNNPDNPLRDWSFIFVPYCTGDVHMGSNTATYRDVDTGEPFTIEHRGADNFRVVLEWARRHFRAPQQILVTGSSAGAYGAEMHFPRIRDAFPRGRAIMLGDGGQGVATPEFTALRNQAWHAALPSALQARDAAQEEDLVALLAARYPRDRFAQVTSAHDATQAGFYALMGAEDACRTWSQKMVRDLGARQSASNFRSYIAAGRAHTILRAPRFYTETSGGEHFIDWFSGLLRDDAAGWDNLACAECAAPPPAPCGF